jgi:hypothetical protein
MLDETPAINVTTPPHEQESISEVEVCARWGKCPKTLFIMRKTGRMPTDYRTEPHNQVRYFLRDIEAHEQNSAQ